MKKFIILFLTLICILSFSEETVNVYTSRHYDADQLLYDEFEKETGIKVNVHQDKDVNALIKKLELEGKSTPADVFIAVGAGDLYTAQQKGLIRKFESDVIRKNVNSKFLTNTEYYVPITYRARVLVYNPKVVDVKDLSTYEDLALPKWNGKVLTRSSQSSYNRHLLAFLIAKDGYDKTLEFTKGLVNNLSRDPKGNDRDQAKAVLNGVGEVAIMNSYYMGIMSVSKDPVEQEVYKNLKLFFPNQKDGGTHINVSGAAITTYSKNLNNAKKFIEFLTSTKAQQMIVDNNFEYPTNDNVNLPKVMKEWGNFKASDISFTEIGKNLQKAQKLADEAKFK